MKAAKWENWVNLLLGAWVFIMPWSVKHTLPEYGMATAMWNFWIVGAIIFFAAMMALRNIEPWEEWTNLTAGVWLLLSPWVFGYAADKVLVANSLVVGAIVAILSVLAIPIAEKNQQLPR